MRIKVLPAIFFSAVMAGTLACTSSGKVSATKQSYPAFLNIGHRGARGLMPENTIPSMIKAIEAGANVIEVDVHLTRDDKVIVYHDASFNPDYTTLPNGQEIAKEERKKYTFYQMNYSDARPFVIGMKPYSLFPQQQRINSYAPLLSELIDSVEAFTKSKNITPVYYLVEVKSNAKTDGVEQPSPERYMEVLIADLKPKQLGQRLIIQSFDMRPLQVLHRKHPEIALGFLTDKRNTTLEENLEQLGFIPAFYNPNYQLLTPELVKKCHDKNIRITPWTVNEEAQMKQIKTTGVDGIITDYPNLLSRVQ
jgi:glycerophosphoryl diester phosphodiesterase